MTIAQLQETYTSIPWLEYINSIMSPFIVVDDKEIVNVIVLDYLKNFEKVIKRTPKRFFLFLRACFDLY